jgi:multidrug resistance efflux pump
VILPPPLQAHPARRPLWRLRGAPAAASLCSPRSCWPLPGTGGWFGYHYLAVGRFLVTTDDACVQAYNTTLAAKVAGYVASVPVTDNT